MIRSRPLVWLALVAITVCTVFIATALAVAISSSRSVGIGWGVPAGMVFGHLILTFMIRGGILVSLGRTSLYSLMLFCLLKYLSDIDREWQIGAAIFASLIAVALVLSWELSALLSELAARWYSKRRAH